MRPQYIVNLGHELLRIAKGEILKDKWSRQIYSVDASHYEIEPASVVCPADEHDVQRLCEYSSSKKIPITARGAGTGLLGQSLSSGIILDFSKPTNNPKLKRLSRPTKSDADGHE